MPTIAPELTPSNRPPNTDGSNTVVAGKSIDTRPIGASQPEALDFIGSMLDSCTRHAVIAGNHDGLLFMWNEGARRIYGHECEEVLGRANWETLFESRDVLAARPREILAAAMTSGSWEGIVTQVHKSGHCFTAEIAVTPWLDRRGQTIGFLLIAKEIEPVRSEAANRGTLESALQRSEERFRSAFDYTNVAMVLTDLNHHFVRVNAAFAQTFGYSIEELLELSMGDITHPDDLDESYARREALLSGQSTFFQMEKRYRHKSGHTIWALTNVSLIRDADDNPSLYVGQVQDITERKRAEEALRQAQNRLQYLVSSSPAILFTLLVEGENVRLTWVSNNIRELFGYAVEEAVHPDWWRENLHPDDLAGVMAHVRDDLLVHDRLANEFRFRRSDGKYRWVRNELRLLHDADGATVEAVGSWSDLTERKHLEDQFRQAQKMEAIGRLAGGIAHDFNNLLTVINGYSEILIGNFHAGDPLHEFVQQIRKAGERAASLTRQLLTFSRRQMIVPVVVDLGSLLFEMERMLSRLIGEDIELKIVTRPDLWKVKVDPGQMEQVIMNLVVNARDAMPQGGKLTIETANVNLDAHAAMPQPEVRPGAYVLLAVSDSGCGMDEATKSRIFEPFFTTKSPEKGTGLGLATVYGIVKQSDGRINVYSEPGIGTTFKIHLPRAFEEGSPSKSQLSAPVQYRGTETVLLVEDEDGVRTLTRLVLEKNGYKVIEARSGAEGLLLCQHHPGTIHIMVTDVVMPNMSGRTLAQHLAIVRPDMRVLYLSGYTDEAIVRHGVIDPDTPFLQKPFTTESLARKVREVLDARLPNVD